MIAEYLYRKKKGLEHSHASQRRQQLTVVVTGVVLVALQITTFTLTILHS